MSSITPFDTLMKAIEIVEKDMVMNKINTLMEISLNKYFGLNDDSFDNEN